MANPHPCPNKEKQLFLSSHQLPLASQQRAGHQEPLLSWWNWTGLIFRRKTQLLRVGLCNTQDMHGGQHFTALLPILRLLHYVCPSSLKYYLSLAGRGCWWGCSIYGRAFMATYSQNFFFLNSYEFVSWDSSLTTVEAAQTCCCCDLGV